MFPALLWRSNPNLPSEGKYFYFLPPVWWFDNLSWQNYTGLTCSQYMIFKLRVNFVPHRRSEAAKVGQSHLVLCCRSSLWVLASCVTWWPWPVALQRTQMCRDRRINQYDLQKHHQGGSHRPQVCLKFSHVTGVGVINSPRLICNHSSS